MNWVRHRGQFFCQGRVLSREDGSNSSNSTLRQVSSQEYLNFFSKLRTIIGVDHLIEFEANQWTIMVFSSSLYCIMSYFSSHLNSVCFYICIHWSPPNIISVLMNHKIWLKIQLSFTLQYFPSFRFFLCLSVCSLPITQM